MSRKNINDDSFDAMSGAPQDAAEKFGSALSGNATDGTQSGSFSSEGDVEYDLRSSIETSNDEWSLSGISSRMRRSTGDGPVEYPEGSLGAFSTPEDYEAHADNIVEAREPEEEEQSEYDDPILLFPPDEMDDDYYRTINSGKKHHRRIISDESDIDDSVGISFSRYTAENKEGEFFFMPFLDIPDEPDSDDDRDDRDDRDDEDEGEEVSFSFRKVDAEQVKKEKEFIFMPFLNVSDETDSSDDDGETHRRRSTKGTIFDEGLYLIPLESEEEEEPAPEEEKHEEDEEDSGIYVVGSEGGVVPKAPRVPRPAERKTALKDVDRDTGGRAPSKKKSGKGSGKKKSSPASKKTQSSGGKYSATEEQFRAAMRNVSPEIRAAVKNDPIQRAALEQAVRIALVQQAAQEAVEKTTGRPVFGGSSGGKKRRPPRPPQKPSGSLLGGGSRAKSVNFSPFTLRTAYDDGGVSEFGVTEDTAKTSAAPEFGTAAAASAAAASTPTPTPTPAAQPDSNQDPVLALLNADGSENKEHHDAAPLGRRPAYQSPAAVRAAMRTGLDVDTPQQAQTATATGPKTTVTAAERELQAKRSGCLIWLIVAFVVFFIGLIGILVLPNITKQSNFDKGIDLMNRGQYMQAIQMFEKFDSGDTKFYDDCRVNISECAYRQATQYYSEGKYYEAYNLLISKAIINSETKPLALRSNYYYAEQLYADGDWQNAANAYSYLLSDEYEDSQEKFNICQYQLAQEKVDQGSYLQAYQSFAALGEYSDAPIRAAEMLYEAWNADPDSVTTVQLTDAVNVLSAQGSAETLDILARMYIKAGDYASADDYRSAFETYSALGSYSEAAYNAAFCLYNVWVEDIDYGTLTQRYNAMLALRHKLGDEQAAAVLNSAGFNPVRMLGEWSDGESTMSFTRSQGNADRLVLVMDLESTGGDRIELESSDVGFDGNTVYYLTEPGNEDSRQVLFEITRFDSLVALEPGSFSCFCFLNNREYALERQ